MPKVDIVAQGYNLSINRYKEAVHEEIEHRAPKDILANLAKLEADIQQGMQVFNRSEFTYYLNRKVNPVIIQASKLWALLNQNMNYAIASSLRAHHHRTEDNVLLIE